MIRIFLLIAALVSLAAVKGKAANEPAMAVTGATQTVFDWSTQRCEDLDIPDLPARAFRDAQNQVHLIASHSTTRAAVGSTLLSAVHGCTPILLSTMNPDPSAYQGVEWLASTFTSNGSTVYGLVHDEFQGSVFGPCPSGDYASCWYNALTSTVSTDSGQSFTSRQFAASIPYQYVPDSGPAGYFEPSNLIEKSGFVYAFFESKTAYGAQQQGNCVMRTANIADPLAWRYWTGAAWTGTFINPYTSTENPALHVCAPVQNGFHQSITFNSYFGHYLSVGLMLGPSGYGIYFALSDDFVTWTPFTFGFAVVPPWQWTCGGPDAMALPSALDVTSTDRNFATTGKSFDLYLTRFNVDAACGTGLDRDLVRIPVTLSGKAPKVIH